jgi:hypothetical protein
LARRLVDAESGEAPPPRRSRWYIAIVLVIASVGYVTWIVVAEGDEIDRAVLRFQGAELRWMVAAVLLEGCSQLAASLMQRRLAGAAGTDLTVRHAVGLVLAQNPIGLSVPGGPVLATAYGFRQLRRRGTDPAAATWVIAASNVVTGLAIACGRTGSARLLSCLPRRQARNGAKYAPLRYQELLQAPTEARRSGAVLTQSTTRWSRVRVIDLIRMRRQRATTSGGVDGVKRYSFSALPRMILNFCSSVRCAASRRSWASFSEYGHVVSECG